MAVRCEAVLGVPGWPRYPGKTTVAQGLPPTGTREAKPRSCAKPGSNSAHRRDWLKHGSQPAPQSGHLRLNPEGPGPGPPGIRVLESSRSPAGWWVEDLQGCRERGLFRRALHSCPHSISSQLRLPEDQGTRRGGERKSQEPGTLTLRSNQDSTLRSHLERFGFYRKSMAN